MNLISHVPVNTSTYHLITIPRAQISRPKRSNGFETKTFSFTQSAQNSFTLLGSRLEGHDVI